MNNLIEVNSFLPLLITLIPILASVFIYIIGNYSSRLRNYFLITITAINLFLVIRLFSLVQEGLVVFRLINVLDYGLTFKVDMMGFVFALLISFVWFLVTIYALGYMSHEANQNRFFTFHLLTLGGSLGTVLTGDLFSLFIFFEIMSLGSYVLIAHEEDRKSLSAAKKYIFMAIAGSLFQLMGIFMIYHYAGTLDIISLAGQLDFSANIKYLLAFLLLIGFGMKAGMFPVHIWLPLAHPVAPSPASALLSGIMIKLGIYGLFRVFNMIFTPDYSQIINGTADWVLTQNTGYIIIWLGIITMALGAFMAIFQDNLKKILAYSSVSQIGYILMGIGVAGYIGETGFIGLEGSFYHLLNHAFFKSSLFLIAGFIFIKTHQLNIHKLGGLYKKMPFTTIAFMIAMAGIIGLPGFNGFISKNLLHEAIYEAYYFRGDRMLYYAEKIFKITSIATVVYFSKVLVLAFFGKASDNVEQANEKSLLMKIPFGILSIFVILLGILPNRVTDIIHSAFLTFSVRNIAELNIINFWNSYYIQSALYTILLGVLVFIILYASKLYNYRLSKKMSLETLVYRPAFYSFFLFSRLFVYLFDKKVDDKQVEIGERFNSYSKTFANLFDFQFDSKLESKLLASFLRKGKKVKTFILSINKNAGEHEKVVWDIKNLDFDLFLIVLTLLIIFIYFFPQFYKF